MRYLPPSRPLVRIALVLGIAAALTQPGFVITAIANDLPTSKSIQIHEDDDGNETLTVRTRRTGYTLDVELEGKIEFAPDESDVLGMDADAELEIEETRRGVTRSIAFTRAGAGIARDYRVEGDVHAYDAAARTWVAQMVTQLFRSSGFDAGARAKRILARGGVDALLAEIGQIESDYGRTRYLGVLYAEVKLDAVQQTRAIELTRAIDSDYELRQTLSLALDSRQLNSQQQMLLLDLAQKIDSDYERAELLVKTADRFTLDGDAFSHWSQALDGIDSDYELRRVLEALLRRRDDNQAAVRLAFEAAHEIDSDYEKRQLLEAAVARARGNIALRQDYLRVAGDIDSDYERKQALLTLLRAGSVDTVLALAVLGAIDGMDSDYERKEVLLALAQVMPGDPAVIERYRASARRLSNYERGEAERALDRFLDVT